MDELGTAPLKKKEAWSIPIAIVAAGLILAVAIFVIRSNAVQGSPEADISLLRPINETDHIAGNPAAPVKLIEYADIDSSYSKTFQQTMEQLMTEYGSDGNVAWVYRHLPLIDQHVNSATHAEAAECIASLGGPNIFWRFIGALNTAAPNDQQFDPANYEGIVSSLGILPQSFTACMTSHTFQQKVASDFENGLAIGAGGSPFSVLLVDGQPPITINGSIPYDSMKKILDEAISRSLQAQSGKSAN